MASLGRGMRKVASLFQDIATLVNEVDRRANEDDSDDELDFADGSHGTDEDLAEIKRK
jgi:hypothetical protein